MTRHQTLRIALTACVALAVTSGCGLIGDAEASQPKNSSTGDASTPQPSGDASPRGEASEAGGVCKYLDFPSLKKATGKPFTIAESGGSEEVTSCVVQTTDGSFPDITLTRAKTSTDAKTYEKEIPPKEHDKVSDLGKAAYSAVREPVEKSGPVVEIGWLTKGHMYSLRYTTVANTPAADADATVDPLTDVARSTGELAEKD